VRSVFRRGPALSDLMIVQSGTFAELRRTGHEIDLVHSELHGDARAWLSIAVAAI